MSSAWRLTGRRALALGAVQGLTEFVPVSSSGHLRVIPWLAGWEDRRLDPEMHRALDVALHVGSLVGAGAYLALARPQGRLGLGRLGLGRLGLGGLGLGQVLALGASALPAAATGVLAPRAVEAVGSRPWAVAGVSLAATAVLFAAEGRRPRRSLVDLDSGDALAMGLAQALALLPGVSRSGATISAARLRGLDRAESARVSVAMSLPVIAGAGLWEALSLAGQEHDASAAKTFATGAAAAAIAGALGSWAALTLADTRWLRAVCAYRVASGVVVLGVAARRAHGAAVGSG